ncbi:MAG: uncharacterized protein Athens101410_620 [Parcubacteria group bacterium Athens1014_10]|nr:MAG: uncharacterized protein Athens101410_620 [Parcubacteria group bacterium Athens1014_10]TSD04806.1 MAG: uncharacterized protein Athens071412_590 [Parcubacteria group bacterium Athens0714_12]
MKISKYLQIIQEKNGSLCFNSLMGNLFFLEPLYMNTLKSFHSPRELTEKEKESSIVSELIEAHYLIKNDLEERNILKKRNKKWIKSVVGGRRVFLLNLIVSEICNIACPHCLHKCSVNTNLSHGNKKLMDWPTAEESINLFTNLMAKWKRKDYTVSFGSAEPLINWRVLKKSVIYLKKINPDIKITINTNLLLIDNEKAKFFKENNVYLSTSLDGPKKGNDLIRIYANKKGTYGDILNKFKLLAKIGYPLDGFSITINDKNFNYVDANFIKWASNQGFKGIATDIDLINTLNSSRSVDDYVDKLMELRKACLESGMENFGSWTTAYHNLVNGCEDNMPTFCKAAKGNNVSINPEGNIFICGHTNTLLGNIKYFEKTFYPKSPYCDLIEKRLPGNNQNCFSCYIEGICAGQCQITREAAKRTKNKRDLFLCNFYRAATFKLFKEKLRAELINN